MAGILLLLVGLVNSKMAVGISMGISMAGSCSSRVICSNGGFLKGTQWEYLWGIYIYILIIVKVIWDTTQYIHGNIYGEYLYL